MRGLLGIVLLTSLLATSCIGPLERFGRQIEYLDTPQDPALSALEEQPRPIFAPQAPTESLLTHDWIRLSSNEWLMGDFESLRREVVEFDSDKLDAVTFDWDDVVEIRCRRPMMVVLDDGKVLDGTIRLIGESMLIGNIKPRRISRNRIEAIIPDTGGSAVWRGKFSVSATTRTGNTQQSELTSYGFLRGETPSLRWDTSYTGNFSESNGDQTANSHRGNSRVDVYVSPKLFVVPAGADVFRDPFQNLAYRTTLYSGAGYDFYNTGDDEISIFAGPAWLLESRVSVSADQERTSSEAAGIFGFRFAWEVTSDIDFSFSYQITSPFAEPEAWNHNLNTAVSIDLIDDFDLDVRFVWDRVNRPTANDNDVVPEPDDYRTVIGVAYTF